ncbi:MAG: phage major capsid protein [Lactimicrobium sp.]|jgi:hypothetical protein|uniref:phage major capsid protein n=1 Tax=Lactimicrobium sp. TaxID=2563780 RepID=UPI002F35B600
MKIDTKTKEQFIEMLKNSEDKPEAIYDAISEYVSQANADVVQSILAQAEEDKAKDARDVARSFRPLTAGERKFYEMIKEGPKMNVTGSQIDFIPAETIDYTLNEVKKASGITSLITFTPANVKKWLFGSKTGAAAWGNLTDSITSELTAGITSLNMDVFKLSAFVVIPKAIRELEVGYVDRYVTAILSEAMQDGIVKGYLNGDGKKAPVGIMRQLGATETDGTAKAKTTVTTLTSFSPKGMAAALKTLSHGGVRTLTQLALIANPADVYDYVNPALYADSIVAGYAQKSALPITVYADANCAQGTAVLTIPGVYTMGFQGVQVTEYKETKALDDADVIIAKVYGNGRAADDDAAVVFDPTKLAEYELPAHKTKAAA